MTTADRRAQPVTVPDGRTLMVAEWGDPDGQPVFMCHGTPGCRFNRHPDEERYRKVGARVFTYDRPGYGGSDRHKGRRAADAAADIAAIADSFALDTFAVSGGSGGGPHSLAAAALLGDRVTRAACIVGVAPYDVLGEDWFVGMDPKNIEEFGWGLEGEGRLVTELTREAAETQARVAEDPSKLLDDDWDVPASDRAIMARPDIQVVIREATGEMFRNGVWGWVDDSLAFLNPWGFDPATIRVPTGIWYGRTDVLVPPGHGDWLARTVPDATIKVDEHGHQADPDTVVETLYGWLLDGNRWD
jgi:pimeloyl-ACP methyl ester carboxylesterase